MGIKRNTIIVLFLITVIALAVIIYAVPGVTGLLVETYTAEYGELSIHDDTTGYLVRNEKVYVSDTAGRVNRLAEEGDLLRPHTAVIELSSTGDGAVAGETGDVAIGENPLTTIKKKLGSDVVTSSDYRLETGGIVSFFVDGNENAFTQDSAEVINRKVLENVKQSDVIDLGATTEKGYPVFKIIDNRTWMLIAYVPEEHRDQYVEGNRVNVTFFAKDDGEDEFQDLSDKDPITHKLDMTIVSVAKEGDYAKLVLSSIKYFDGIGQYRVVGARVESKDVRGLLIENESITQVDGVTGVYSKTKTGKHVFMPIKIYGSDDTTTVIADTYFYDEDGNYVRTIDPFDDILRKPGDAEE